MEKKAAQSHQSKSAFSIRLQSAEADDENYEDVEDEPKVKGGKPVKLAPIERQEKLQKKLTRTLSKFQKQATLKKKQTSNFHANYVNYHNVQLARRLEAEKVKKEEMQKRWSDLLAEIMKTQRFKEKLEAGDLPTYEELKNMNH